MANVICAECKKDCANEAILHRHIKAHKLSQAQYYQKHFPRYDKLTGGFILFKNRDFYLTADFNSRANLATWLKQVSDQEKKDYIREYFLKRKKRKQLTYALCQVELRTLPVPGMKYLNELFGDYYSFVKELGFEPKFSQYEFKKKPLVFLGAHRVIVDTREQCPLEFSIPALSEALPFGDYKLNDDRFNGRCYIERKSMNDLYGTLTGGYERFCREIHRSYEADANLIIVVESSFASIEPFSDKLYNYTHKRLSPEFIYHSIRDICQKYRNVQFLFVNDRNEASRAIERIFCSNKEFRNIDLQYAYDTGKLI